MAPSGPRLDATKITAALESGDPGATCRGCGSITNGSHGRARLWWETRRRWKDKGSSFWEHARTVGQGVLEGLLGSTSSKRSVSRNDPMAGERAAAAKQIHRSLKAWRDRAGEGNDEAIQRKPQIPSGGGNALPGGVKSKMEGKLGADFSDVKVHTGGDSEKASEDLNAKAFTVGNDVHFNSGQYDPSSKEGEKLLAHELTHVVQGQRGGVQRKEDSDGADAEGADGEEMEVSDPDEPAEKEADEVSEAVSESRGDTPAIGQTPAAASRSAIFRAAAGDTDPALQTKLASLGSTKPDIAVKNIKKRAPSVAAYVMSGEFESCPGYRTVIGQLQIENEAAGAEVVFREAQRLKSSGLEVKFEITKPGSYDVDVAGIDPRTKEMHCYACKNSGLNNLTDNLRKAAEQLVNFHADGLVVRRHVAVHVNDGTDADFVARKQQGTKQVIANFAGKVDDFRVVLSSGRILQPSGDL